MVAGVHFELFIHPCILTAVEIFSIEGVGSAGYSPHWISFDEGVGDAVLSAWLVPAFG